MALGLAGAHRTGKTTLATEIAEQHGIQFLQTVTASIFEREGVDPSLPMPFEVRMRMQNLVLDSACEIWSGATGTFVSDRTPVDMLAYTMADMNANRKLSNSEESLVVEYIKRCYKASNDHFQVIILIQPGIPVMEAMKLSGPMDAMYMEHFNFIAVGALTDARSKNLRYVMPRAILSLQGRVDYASRCYSNHLVALDQERLAVSVH